MDSLDNIMLYGSRSIGLADNIMQWCVAMEYLNIMHYVSGSNGLQGQQCSYSVR